MHSHGPLIQTYTLSTIWLFSYKIMQVEHWQWRMERGTRTNARKCHTYIRAPWLRLFLSKSETITTVMFSPSISLVLHEKSVVTRQVEGYDKCSLVACLGYVRHIPTSQKVPNDINCLLLFACLVYHVFVKFFNGSLMPLCPFFYCSFIATHNSAGRCLWTPNINWDIW